VFGQKYCKLIPSYPETSGDEVKFYMAGVQSGAYVILMDTLNTSNDSVTRDTCTLDFGGQNQDDVMPVFSSGASSSAYSYNVALRTVTFEANSVNYVLFCVEVGSVTTYSDYSPAGVWVFERDTAGTTLTYKSKLNEDGTAAIMPIGNDYSKILVVNRNGHIKTYSFNNTTQAYDYASTLTTESFDEVCIDNQNRIYTRTKNTNKINIFMSDIPTTISVVPEHDNYDYQGSTINSYLTVNAYNHLGDRIAVDVRLKLIGSNITFDNGEVETTVTTSDSSDTTVNIKIDGASYVRVAASVVV